LPSWVLWTRVACCRRLQSRRQLLAPRFPGTPAHHQPAPRSVLPSDPTLHGQAGPPVPQALSAGPQAWPKSGPGRAGPGPLDCGSAGARSPVPGPLYLGWAGVRPLTTDHASPGRVGVRPLTTGHALPGVGGGSNPEPRTPSPCLPTVPPASGRAAWPGAARVSPRARASLRRPPVRAAGRRPSPSGPGHPPPGYRGRRRAPR
jgi:hypothetical protein